MPNELTNSNFTQLPNWIQQKIHELGVSNPNQWGLTLIPALGDRSVVEVAKTPGGEQILRDYFAKVIGRF